MSVNKAILVGNLGQDPESRSFPSGGSICNISIATTESWNDKNSGEKKSRTTWHTVVLQNKLGEIAQKYLKKGSQVYIEGTIRHREYEQNGIKRYATEIVGREMRMLGSKNGSNTEQSSPIQSPTVANNATAQEPQQSADYLDDDIPFN